MEINVGDCEQIVGATTTYGVGELFGVAQSVQQAASRWRVACTQSAKWLFTLVFHVARHLVDTTTLHRFAVTQVVVVVVVVATAFVKVLSYILYNTYIGWLVCWVIDGVLYYCNI